MFTKLLYKENQLVTTTYCVKVKIWHTLFLKVTL